ncbi:HTH-type transcriptional activator rhaR [Streptococcus dysgalactiae]|nr:HTH-type transcriptional activator rhaR [Streptococcus dysgalactiae subsp. dysgalactiae]SUN50187.1 HTH-type transcriptional activator rhaR [Streptococcus dysgalactiae]SUN55276.1 HTH-type transcriptional activator rhaR [Streptococcus dysgalactiae]
MFNKLQPRLGIQAKRKPLPYRYFQTVINDGRPDILFH